MSLQQEQKLFLNLKGVHCEVEANMAEESTAAFTVVLDKVSFVSKVM